MSLAVAANSRCELLLRAAGMEPPFTSHAFEKWSRRLASRCGGGRGRRPPASTGRVAADGATRGRCASSVCLQHQPARSTICCCSSQKGRAAARGLPELQPAGNCRVAQLPAPPDPIPDLLISRGHHRLPPLYCPPDPLPDKVPRRKHTTSTTPHNAVRPPSSSYAAPSAPLLASILSLSSLCARAAWKGDLERQLMHSISFSHTFNRDSLSEP